MPAPKSVTKLKIKNGSAEVEYVSDVDAANYYLFELTRAALRDVGKFIAREFRAKFYSSFKRHEGSAGKVTRYNVWSSRNTQYPKVQVGLQEGHMDGFYAYYQEFGNASRNVPKMGLLTHAAQDNIAQIISIESQYLSGLSDAAARLEQQVNESEMEGDGDD